MRSAADDDRSNPLASTPRRPVQPGGTAPRSGWRIPWGRPDSPAASPSGNSRLELFRRLSRLRRLAAIPLLPQLFDTCLLMRSLLFDPGCARELEAVRRAVSAWPGVRLSLHRYGGLQFNRQGRELGHCHGNGVVDVLLPRRQRDQQVAAGGALPHHTLPASGWVSLCLRTPADAERAIALFELAYRWRENPAGHTSENDV